MGSQGKIFISYSRRDLAFVKPIKDELETNGFPCWMDLDGIESGAEEFTEHIARAIDDSNVVLFFLSDNSQLSRWSLNELRLARRKRKRIVLVRFNNDEMNDRFFLEFGGTDIIDWCRFEQKTKLLNDLKRWMKGVTPSINLCRAGGRPAKQQSFWEQGENYYWGKNGVQRDFRMAFKCYREVAELGHVEAQFSLGVMYANGRGVQQDDVEAVKWYRKAAENGNARAKERLEAILKNAANDESYEAKSLARALSSHAGEVVVCRECGKRNILKDSIKCKACGRVLL